MKLTVVLASSAFVLSAVACGGASETELFSAAGDSQLSSGAGGSGASSGGPGTSSGGGGSSSGGSSSGGSSSGGSSSGGVEDAGPEDPPAPPDAPTIACGTSDCALGTQICCARRDLSLDMTFACQASGPTACIGGLAIACDDRTDCPTDQVCCGVLTSTKYTSVSCKKSCEPTTGATRTARFCDPAADVDECAAIGKSCLESQSLPGYYVCQD